MLKFMPDYSAIKMVIYLQNSGPTEVLLNFPTCIVLLYTPTRFVILIS